MCEGQGSNPILNKFVIQMRGGLCPDYNSDSDVVQLNIKTEKNMLWRHNFPSQKSFGPKPSRRQKIGAKTSRRQNVLAPKRHTPHIQRLNWFHFHINNIKNKNSVQDKLITFYKMMKCTYKWRKKNKKPYKFLWYFTFSCCTVTCSQENKCVPGSAGSERCKGCIVSTLWQRLRAYPHIEQDSIKII